MTLFSGLRSDLSDARFTVEGLDALFGADASAALFRGNRVPALRRLQPRHPLSTLARLFVLGLPASREELDAALPRTGAVGAVELGLAEPDAESDGRASGGDVIRPLLDLRPYSFVDSAGVGSWWIASDRGELATGAPLREDHVLGIGGASTTLSGIMMHTPAARVLDLGTGCGIQALHASRHATHVIATDISARAVDIARFTVDLNDVRNIEVRQGDLFAPVAGERFEQIVSNPPFVITPREPSVPAYDYRDGGLVGDALVAAVIEGAVAHLAPGGVAQLLGNWEYHSEASGLDRTRAVIDALPGAVDAWVIEREVQDPARYAETWIRDGGTRPGPEYDRLVGVWLDDFADRGVTAVGFGYITLRARTADDPGTPLRRLERVDGVLGQGASGLSDHLATCFDAQRRLTALSDEQLGSRVLLLAQDVTEERHYWPGAEDPTVMTLRQGGGFGRSHRLDTALAAFVGVCDGELAVGAIIAAIADLLDADAASLSAALLPEIRELLATGFLRF